MQTALATVLARTLSLLAFWLLLTGASPGDLPAGALAAAAGAWASMRLLPPRRAPRLRVAPWLVIAGRLALQSLVAGTDVARRALAPRLRLRPGIVSHPLHLPPGPARDAFCALTSLLPGTVPSGYDERGALLVHCLDREQPVAAQLAADEARFARALGAHGDG